MNYFLFFQNIICISNSKANDLNKYFVKINDFVEQSLKHNKNKIINNKIEKIIKKMLNRILNNLNRSQYLSHSLLSLFLKQDLNQMSRLSTIRSESKREIVDTFRTNETNPSQHSTQHLSMYYTMPSEVVNKLFVLGGWHKEQQITFKTFNETSIMIRSPALEVIQYLKKADYSRFINRYVLCMDFNNIFILFIINY